MEPRKRIPKHAHSGNNDGGLIAGSTVVSVASSGTGGGATTAAEVSILDTAGYFAATDVEAALAELAAGGGGGTLDGLSDVDTTGVADNDVLAYDSGTATWGPVAPSSGSGVTVQDEGTPLSTTATTLDFVGAGVTATGSGATKTITIPGGGTPRWLNVEDYGAVHDGTTDDTAAIQAAIDDAETNALSASGPTEVFFPDGVYVIAGALQDTSRSNAQLLLPLINTTSQQQIAIRLFGQTPSRPIVSVGATTVTTPTNGVILKSTLGSGTGALLGGKGPSGSWQDGTAVQLQIENIAFRMPADPTNSCLDFRYVMGIELVNVLVDTGEYNLPSVTEPSTSTSFGVRTPSNVTSSGFAWLRTVNAVGFYNGFELSELSNSDMVHAWACKRAFTITAANHSVLAKRLGAYGCTRGIYTAASAGSTYLDVLDFDTEHETNPPNPSWLLAVYDIDDANGALRGHVRFHNQTYGSSPGGMPLINGAAGLSISVGWERWHRLTGSLEMPTAPIAPSTPASGGALYSDAGGSGKPYWKDSGGTVYDLTAGGSPTGSAGGDLSGTYPNPSVVDDSHNHTSATLPASAASGEILILDTPAGSPLIFADLIQNEAGTDLLYEG